MIPDEIAVMHICEASLSVIQVCSRSMNKESYPEAFAIWTISTPRQILSPKDVQIFPWLASETRLLVVMAVGVDIALKLRADVFGTGFWEEMNRPKA